MEILKAGLLEIASQVSPKDTELLHERILAANGPYVSRKPKDLDSTKKKVHLTKKIVMFDLNVPALVGEAENACKGSLKTIYSVCASTNVINGKNLTKDVGNSKHKETTVDELKGLIQQAQHGHNTFSTLRRLTIVLDDSCNNCNINGAKLKGYDLLAVRPLTEKAFQQSCSLHDVEIISLDMTGRMPFFLKATTINMAVQRGIMFEICYGPAIRDSIARRQTIANANSLLRVLSYKNILISSEAIHDMDIRGPRDVMNIATLLGLSEDQARYCMTTSGRNVLYHAVARKETFRSVLTHEPSSAVEATQPWKLGESPHIDQSHEEEYAFSYSHHDDMALDG
ncbi:RNase P subunit p30-domain-containing protein [Chytridium lagenaria]|nr:RNase P subunit p30-domain-containing protein [Chytridium lagenaria]